MNNFQGREARLKTEYAHLYPPLQGGRWEPAGVMADRMVAWLLRQPNRTGFVSPHRILRPEHFEFRGGTQRAQGLSTPLTRREDQELSGSD
jgi:hypothetical protein